MNHGSRKDNAETLRRREKNAEKDERRGVTVVHRFGVHRSAVLFCAISIFLFSVWTELRARESAAQQTQTGVRYANSAEGLKLFLKDGVAAAKSGDKSRLDALMKDTSILRAYEWFVGTYGEEKGASRVQDYGNNIGGNEADVRETLARIGHLDGEISTRSINAHPEPGNEIESEMLQGLKRPTSFYYAEWRRPGAPPAEKGELIGYFVYVTGKFRIARVRQRAVALHGVRDPKTGVTTYELPRPARPSISGTKYTNPEGHFTLDLPPGWTINEEVAKTPMAIGGVSDSDGWANVAIQEWPQYESPAELLRKFDAHGPTMFEDYKRLGESALTLDGQDAALLRITSMDRQTKFIGITIPTRMEWFVIAVHVEDHNIVFNFVTTEALFAAKEMTFRGIINSFRLTGK